MKQTKQDIRAEIEKIIIDIFDRVDDSTWKEARQEAANAILELVKSKIPKEKEIDYRFKENYKEYIGWNACRTEILEELGSGE